MSSSQTKETFKKIIAEGEVLFRDSSKWDEALLHFKGMSQQYPGNSYFKIRLAELLINKRQWVEAESLTTELISKESPKFFAYQFHAIVLIKTGKLVVAKELLEKALKLFPDKKNFTTTLFLLQNLNKRISLLRKLLAS